jgi:hypothetical protein
MKEETILAHIVTGASGGVGHAIVSGNSGRSRRFRKQIWDDEKLVRLVDELGEEANGHGAKLKIVEIPDDVKWEIEKIDGVEHVRAVHGTWR